MAKAKDLDENKIEEVATEEVAKVEEEVATEEVATEEVAKEKTYMVETPVKNFNGTVAGVQFAYGKAEVCEGHILNWFKKKGYKVTAL